MRGLQRDSCNHHHSGSAGDSKFLLLFLPHSFNFRHRGFSSVISPCTEKCGSFFFFFPYIKEFPEILFKSIHIKTLMQAQNRNNLFGSVSRLCPHFWSANLLLLIFSFKMAEISKGLLHRWPGAM